MTIPWDPDGLRDDALRKAAADAQKDRRELHQGARLAKLRALDRARMGTTGRTKRASRGGHVRTGALTGDSGATLGYAVVRGTYRAIRNAPGVAKTLWNLADQVAEEIAARADTGDESRAEYQRTGHFRTDGSGAKPGNPRGSYRTSVRTYTRKAVVDQHDDHLLEAALAAVKSKGIRK